MLIWIKLFWSKPEMSRVNLKGGYNLLWYWDWLLITPERESLNFCLNSFAESSSFRYLSLFPESRNKLCFGIIFLGFFCFRASNRDISLFLGVILFGGSFEVIYFYGNSNGFTELNAIFTAFWISGSNFCYCSLSYSFWACLSPAL